MNSLNVKNIVLVHGAWADGSKLVEDRSTSSRGRGITLPACNIR